MRYLPRSVCFCKPCQPALDTKDFTIGTKASPWGARLTALPSASGCLGAYVLRPSLGRHASIGSARLLAAMQDIWVSLHSIRSRLVLFRQLHHRPTTNIATASTTSSVISSFDAPFKTLLGILGYWVLFLKASSRSTRLQKPPWGRPCQTPCSYARRSGCLFTLFDQDHDLVFFFFWSIKPAMLPASMLGDYSTSASLTPSCFPCRIDLLGKPFLITSLLDLLFLLFFFLGPSYRPSCLPWCSDTTHECIFDALWNFSSSFRSIGSLLPIARHSTSLHSARLQTGRLPSRFVLFSFGPTCMLFDLSIALRLHHDLSKVAAPTTRSGAYETWVPLGPHRPGSRPSPASGSGLLEDPPTCQWAQST
jgi:hypothetical protein